MGSFKRIVSPIIRGIFREIKQAGTKRAMSSARTIVDGLQARIADGKLTRAERKELGLMTKEEAGAFAQQLLMDGLQISGAAASALVSANVKAKNQGVSANETGFKEMDELHEDDDSDDKLAKMLGED